MGEITYRKCGVFISSENTEQELSTQIKVSNLLKDISDEYGLEELRNERDIKNVLDAINPNNCNFILKK